jgi:hypothetical protein
VSSAKPDNILGTNIIQMVNINNIHDSSSNIFPSTPIQDADGLGKLALQIHLPLSFASSSPCCHTTMITIEVALLGAVNPPTLILNNTTYT